MVKIFVGNCGSQTTGDELRSLFSRYGRVTEADIIGQKGFGFIHMDTQNQADAAIAALNGTDLNGNRLRVEMAGAGRGRGRGGFGRGGPVRSMRGGRGDGLPYPRGSTAPYESRGGFRSGESRSYGRSNEVGSDASFDRQQVLSGGRSYVDYKAGRDRYGARDAAPVQQERSREYEAHFEPRAPIPSSYNNGRGFGSAGDDYFSRKSPPRSQRPRAEFSGPGRYENRQSSRVNDGPSPAVFQGRSLPSRGTPLRPY